MRLDPGHGSGSVGVVTVGTVGVGTVTSGTFGTSTFGTSTGGGGRIPAGGGGGAGGGGAGGGCSAAVSGGAGGAAGGGDCVGAGAVEPPGDVLPGAARTGAFLRGDWFRTPGLAAARGLAAAARGACTVAALALDRGVERDARGVVPAATETPRSGDPGKPSCPRGRGSQ